MLTLYQKNIYRKEVLKMSDFLLDTLFLMQSKAFADKLTKFCNDEELYTKRVDDLQVLVYTDDDDTVNYIKENCEGIVFTKLIWMD